MNKPSRIIHKAEFDEISPGVWVLRGISSRDDERFHARSYIRTSKIVRVETLNSIYDIAMAPDPGDAAE